MYDSGRKQAVQTLAIHYARYIRSTHVFSHNIITKKILNNRHGLYTLTGFGNLRYSGRNIEHCCAESTVSMPEKWLYAVTFLCIR